MAPGVAVDQPRITFCRHQRRDGEPALGGALPRRDDGHRNGKTSPELAHRIAQFSRGRKGVLVVDVSTCGHVPASMSGTEWRTLPSKRTRLV